MKFGKLFLCVIASAALLAGCKEEEPVTTGTPSISVDATALKAFSIQGGQDEIQQVTVTSNRDWEIEKKVEWIHVNPESGSASDAPQTVDIYVDSNEDGIARNAKITFKAGVVNKEVTISQEGKEVEYTDIADIRALGASSTKIEDGTYIKGIVISDQKGLDNLSSNKSIYLQDGSAGIQLFCAANVHEDYVRGDEVTVDISGLMVSQYGQALQIVEGVDAEGRTIGVPVARLSKVSSGNAITAKEITMEQLLSYEFEGQYVSISSPVQVVDADLEKTFVVGGKATSIKFTDAEGYTFEVRTSQYAKFKDEQVPQGSGILKGIASRYNNTAQVVFSTEEDWTALTGVRFEIEVPEAEAVTIEEFLAKDEGATYYQLEGVVTGLEDSPYGNFTLVDATGEVYVYGCDASATAGDKTFSQTGVKEGDVIVLIGKRASFNGNPQVGDAYYVSHREGFAVSPLTLSIPAGGGETTFNITGGVAWTAVSDNGAFTVETQSGTGAATVTVSASANETGAAISGKITVSTEEDMPVKSYEIEISQGANVAGAKYYVKVTSAPSDWSGKYLIVYEKDGLALDGSLSKIDAVNNYKEVSVVAGQIESNATTDAIAFTIASEGSGWSLLAPNGKYIGQTAKSNGLREADSPIEHTLSVASDQSTEVVTTESGRVLRFNNGSDQMRFRYYGSGQQPVALYKLSE